MTRADRPPLGQPPRPSRIQPSVPCAMQGLSPDPLAPPQLVKCERSFEMLHTACPTPAGHNKRAGRSPRVRHKPPRSPTPCRQRSNRAVYRTLMPDRFVYILAAMFIDASSWKRSLAAYGMCTCEILVLFLHGRHSNDAFLRFLRPISIRTEGGGARETGHTPPES